MKARVLLTFVLITLISCTQNTGDTPREEAIVLQPGESAVCATCVPRVTDTPTMTSIPPTDTPTHTSIPSTITPTDTDTPIPPTPTDTPQPTACDYIVPDDYTTIQHGVNILNAGDVLCVRNGTYREAVTISRSGITGSPITVQAYPGERPIIDGRKSLPSGWGALIWISGNYVRVDGFDVRNSASIGVRLGGTHSEVHNLFVHHSYENGVLVQGHYNLVEGCDVWWNSTRAENGHYSGWWAGGLNAARHPSYATIRGNTVRQNWGEGLSAFEADHVTIEDNIIYDNWSADVYISDVTDVLFQRNLIYGVPGSVVSDDRNDTPCIGLADERQDPLSRRITIVNNLTKDCDWSLYWWSQTSGSGLIDVLIAYNTFVNSVTHANFSIDRGSHSNVYVANNLILQEGSIPIASVVSNPDLDFSNNLWSKTPPSSVQGNNDVIGDPVLAQAGPTGAGKLTPSWFKILSGSLARASGLSLPRVTEDFFRDVRDDPPDIGAHEY